MRRGTLAVAGAGVLVLGLTLTGCGNDEKNSTPVRPQSVKLSGSSLPKTVRLGLVVSLKAAPGQGSEWTEAATGAQVATYRYQLGGHRVSLEVVDDHGTSAGTRAAMTQLVDDKVSGIVVGTSGSHLQGALGTPDETPVLLPYATSTAGLPDSAWLTGPSAQQLGSTLSTLVADRGWKAPVVVHGAGSEHSVDGLEAGDDITVGRDNDLKPVVKKIQLAQKNLGSGVVVADLPAQSAAGLVVALQSAKVTLPVVLGRDGVSPAFGDQLAQDRGSLSGQLFSAGAADGDVTSLGNGSEARSTAAYFAAMNGAANSAMKGLFDQGHYGSAAGASDTASHDAVVALVRAVGAAHSATPAKVCAALTKLTLSGSDGLAGPRLDFGKQSALAGGSVVPLVATDQNPGVRPSGAGTAQKLFWFAMPSDKES